MPGHAAHERMRERCRIRTARRRAMRRQHERRIRPRNGVSWSSLTNPLINDRTTESIVAITEKNQLKLMLANCCEVQFRSSSDRIDGRVVEQSKRGRRHGRRWLYRIAHFVSKLWINVQTRCLTDQDFARRCTACEIHGHLDGRSKWTVIESAMPLGSKAAHKNVTFGNADANTACIRGAKRVARRASISHIESST